MAETVIDLIRHGEPMGGSRYRGHAIDDPLSEKGWRQMQDALGQSRPWQVIVSSPLLRCSEFARSLSEALDVPCETDIRLQEIGFGAWEGKTRQQLVQEVPDQYHAFYRDPLHCRPPGAENLSVFIERTTQAYEDILQRHSGKHVLCVTHAGVMRAIISHTLHASPLGMYKIKIDNAGITRIRDSGLGGVLEFINQSLE
jgi:alpha-ribazole phosphatase